MAGRLHHLAARIFGTPLLVDSKKLDAIVGALGPRLGLDVAQAAEGPEFEPKERAPLEVSDGVAVVQVVGSLAHRVSGLDAMSGASSYQTIAEELKSALDDPSVRGILLEVDSFGGEAAGCFDLADKVHAAAQVKPVYGVASQYALSAGYALLSQCTRVFVPQSGEVGSIGVVTTHVDLSAAAAAEGVRVTHVHAGARKVDYSPYQQLSAEARSRMESEVGQLYATFLDKVSRARGERLTADAARETEAGTYMGERAVRAGLADEVGDLGAARSALAAEIEKEKNAMKELDQLREDNARLLKEAEGLKAQLSTSEKARTALQAALDQHKAAEADRKSTELDQLVSDLVSDCEAAGVTPPDAEERTELRKALDEHEPLGRKLLDATRERVLAVGRGAVKRTGLTPPASDAEQSRRSFVSGVVGVVNKAANSAAEKE